MQPKLREVSDTWEINEQVATWLYSAFGPYFAKLPKIVCFIPKLSAPWITWRQQHESHQNISKTASFNGTRDIRNELGLTIRARDTQFRQAVTPTHSVPRPAVSTPIWFFPSAGNKLRVRLSCLPIRPVNRSGTPGGRRVFWEGGKFLSYAQHIFPGGRRAPSSYGPASNRDKSDLWKTKRKSENLFHISYEEWLKGNWLT